MLLKPTLFLSSALVLLSLASISPLEARETSLSGNFLASRSAFTARDSVEASKYLSAALRQDPGNPSITERLFQMQLASGSMAEAERLALSVLNFNSQHRMARTVLGLQEFRARRYAAAREHFSEAAYTPVGELTSSLLAAWSRAGEGELNPAMDELDKLDRNESFANFKSFHGALIADYLGHAIRAEQSYKKAYSEAGTSVRVVQAYGNFLERNNRASEAEKIYRAYIEGTDGNAMIEAALARLTRKEMAKPFIETPTQGAGEALFSLAAAMNDDQSIDVALLYTQMALAMQPDAPVMLTLLGDILSNMRRIEEANAAYERVPTSSELRNNADTEIAVNLQRLEKTADAKARINAILSRDPKNFEAWVTLGNLHRSNEEYVDASKAYDEAVKLLDKPERQHWTLFYYRGIALERQKRLADAEVEFRKALALSPDEPNVLNYLGYSLIDNNMKLNEALEMVKKAVERKPNDGYIVDSLGWAHYMLKNYEEAVVHLERAVDLKPGDAVIAEHLGDAYWRVGRKLEAKFQWQHAKDNKPAPSDLKRIEEKLLKGLEDLPAPVQPADNATTVDNKG